MILLFFALFSLVIQLLNSILVLEIAREIGKDLSKAGILYGELRHVARKKEHCIPWY